LKEKHLKGKPEATFANEANSSFSAGLRAELPLLVGVFPAGVIYGALAIGLGLSALSAQSMSSVLFAGTSQFVLLQLASQATPTLLIVLSIAIVNLRHILYSASIAPHLEKVNLKWKVLLAYLLTDEAYAPSIVKYEKHGATPHSHYFLLGAGLALWLTWQISTAIGISIGATIPESWPLGFALPLTLIAIVVPTLRKWPTILSALSAGTVALLAYNLPYNLGIIIGALAGILVGVFSEGRK
jgi:predicted branched-subunit amino acid permease